MPGECDKALRKLAEMSSILERSATLEKDFEQDLLSIQEKFQTGLELKNAEEDNFPKLDDWKVLFWGEIEPLQLANAHEYTTVSEYLRKFVLKRFSVVD